MNLNFSMSERKKRTQNDVEGIEMPMKKRIDGQTEMQIEKREIKSTIKFKRLRDLTVEEEKILKTIGNEKTVLIAIKNKIKREGITDFYLDFLLAIEDTEKVFKFLIENCKCIDIWNIKEIEDKLKNDLRVKLIEKIDMFTTISRKNRTKNE